MKFKKLSLLVGFVCFGATNASASLIYDQAVAIVSTPFAISGTFAGGATLSGTLSINLSTGTVTGGTLAISGISNSFTVVSNYGSEASGPPNVYQGITFGDGAGDTLVLDIYLGNATSLTGFTGSQLCGTSDNCTASYISYYSTVADPQLLSGTVGNATPEPASLSLLAAPAMFLLFRKKLRARLAI